MQKVRLVFHKNFIEIPTFRDTIARDIEVELPKGFESVRLAGARVYGAEPSPHKDPSGDLNTVVVQYQDFSHFLGRLLTYVDATFSDPEQRQAHKALVKELVYNWQDSLSQRAVQTVDAHDSEDNSSVRV